MQKYYKLKDQRFLSTPSARRATKSKRTARIFTPISIHALREESDAGTQRFCGACQISIHALREEGD